MMHWIFKRSIEIETVRAAEILRRERLKSERSKTDIVGADVALLLQTLRYIRSK